MATTREELIFEELIELIPIGDKAVEQQKEQLYNPTIQHAKLSVPADDLTFEILSNALTSPSREEERNVPVVNANATNGNDNGDDSGNDNDNHDNDNDNHDNDNHDNEQQDFYIKRSYRIMTYIIQDLAEAKEFLKQNFNSDNDDIFLEYILNPTRAVLLAKNIFASYRSLLSHYQSDSSDLYNPDIPKPHIPHLNKLLHEVLLAFPTQVVGASCAGGGKGVEKSLESMLQLHKYVSPLHSPLNTIREIINIGTTGRRNEELTLQQQQQMAMMGQTIDVDKVHVHKGHRKKFVHGLCQWGGWLRFMDLIYHDGSCTEEVMGVVLESIEFISFPAMTNALSMASASGSTPSKKDDESVGEETLLGKIASEEFICNLFKLLNRNAKNCQHFGKGKQISKQADAVAGALLGLFELATGKARRQVEESAPAMTNLQDEGVECKAADEVSKSKSGIDDNKMVKSGITDKMHSAICKEMNTLVAVMDIYVDKNKREVANSTDPASTTVKHPGRYIIEKPFTCIRLKLLTLFTDLVSYESHCPPTTSSKTSSSKFKNNNEETYTCAKQALELIMELPLPCTIEAEDSVELEEVYNPLPGICDLIFEYPENNMLQVQFYRLIHALCVTNHEQTLKLVVQKCKFLSKAIKTCSAKVAPCSTRGVLLRCLNALRLHSQSISPHSFLRHYLESHDGWKDFQDELTRMTLEQQQRGGGIAVPISQGEQGVIMPQSEIDINLGSAFAAELGFASDIESYLESADDSISEVISSEANGGASSPSKKKKKKSKKKKNKK